MNGLGAALYAELLKARRSRVSWLTALGFSLAPVMRWVFMVILKDPERARRLGLIGAKAQITAGTADWPTYLGVLAQIMAATAWGAYFPWPVPALFSGLAGPRGGHLVPASYVLVGPPCLGGLAAIFAWWRWADQTG